MGIVGAKSTQLVLDRGWGGGIGYNINSITVVCYLPCACILILSHFFFPSTIPFPKIKMRPEVETVLFEGLLLNEITKFQPWTYTH